MIFICISLNEDCINVWLSQEHHSSISHSVQNLLSLKKRSNEAICATKKKRCTKVLYDYEFISTLYYNSLHHTGLKFEQKKRKSISKSPFVCCCEYFWSNNNHVLLRHEHYMTWNALTLSIWDRMNVETYFVCLLLRYYMKFITFYLILLLTTLSAWAYCCIIAELPFLFRGFWCTIWENVHKKVLIVIWVTNY